jgi:hypothetical protein
MYKGYDMTRTIKYKPEDNKFLGPKPGMSVMMALETAVLLLEQGGETEEDIMKYVHMICMGWIRNGELAPEYLELVQKALREQAEQDIIDSKLSALRESVTGSSLSSDAK